MAIVVGTTGLLQARLDYLMRSSNVPAQESTCDLALERAHLSSALAGVNLTLADFDRFATELAGAYAQVLAIARRKPQSPHARELVPGLLPSARGSHGEAWSKCYSHN
ncbi:hypothetical protein T492DRAFT_832372 [Pavlovales sp. CCMP2436]|nr:hypothetical protein T492DRAFT_832372 [Pavlovales sp. CCMP2436]